MDISDPISELPPSPDEDDKRDHRYLSSPELQEIYRRLYPKGDFVSFCSSKFRKNSPAIALELSTLDLSKDELDFGLRQFLWYLGPVSSFWAFSQSIHKWKTIQSALSGYDQDHLIPWQSLLHTAGKILEVIEDFRREHPDKKLFSGHSATLKVAGFANPLMHKGASYAPLNAIILNDPELEINLTGPQEQDRRTLIARLAAYVVLRSVERKSVTPSKQDNTHHADLNAPYRFLNNKSSQNAPDISTLAIIERHHRNWCRDWSSNPVHESLETLLRLPSYTAFLVGCQSLLETLHADKSAQLAPLKKLLQFFTTQIRTHVGGKGGSGGGGKKGPKNKGRYYPLELASQSEFEEDMYGGQVEKAPLLIDITEEDIANAKVAGEDPSEDDQYKPKYEIFYGDDSYGAKLKTEQHARNQDLLMASLNQQFSWDKTGVTHAEMERLMAFLANKREDSVSDELTYQAAVALSIVALVGVDIDMALSLEAGPPEVDDKWLKGATLFTVGGKMDALGPKVGKSERPRLRICLANIKPPHEAQELVPVWVYPIPVRALADHADIQRSNNYEHHRAAIAFHDQSGLVLELLRKHHLVHFINPLDPIDPPDPPDPLKPPKSIKPTANVPLVRIFEHSNTERIKDRCFALLKELNVTQYLTEQGLEPSWATRQWDKAGQRNLTLGKIRQFTRTGLISSGVDTTFVDVLDWNTPKIQTVACHYYAKSLHAVVAPSKAKSSQGLQFKLTERTSLFNIGATKKLPPTKPYIVGATGLPNLEILRTRLGTLKDQITHQPKVINLAGDLEDWVKAFNAYGFYLTLWFCCETSHRPHHTPFTQTKNIDPLFGLLLLKDKSNIEGDKFRLGSASVLLQEQMREYAKILRKLISFSGAHYKALLEAGLPVQCTMEKSSGEDLKALGASLDFTLVSAKIFGLQIKEHLQIEEANFYRKLIPFLFGQKNRLAEVGAYRNTKPEEKPTTLTQIDIDLWLGHWNHGTAPFHQFGTVCIAESHERIQKHLAINMTDLGFQPLAYTLPKFNFKPSVVKDGTKSAKAKPTKLLAKLEESSPAKRSKTPHARWFKKLNATLQSRSLILEKIIGANPPPASIKRNGNLSDPQKIAGYLREQLIRTLLVDLEFHRQPENQSICAHWALGLLELPLDTLLQRDDDSELADADAVADVIADTPPPSPPSVLSASPVSSALFEPGFIRTNPEQDALKNFYTRYVNQLFTDIVRTPASLAWLFKIVDEWRMVQESALPFGFTTAAALCMHFPEENVYTQEEVEGYLELTHLLKAFEIGTIKPIDWKALAPEQQFGAYLFCLICFSGISNLNKLKRIAHLSILKPTADEPYSSLLLPSNKDLVTSAYEQDRETDKAVFSRFIPDPISAKALELFSYQWDGIDPQLHLFKVYIEPFLSSLLIPPNPAKQKVAKHERAQVALDYFSSMQKLQSASKTLQRVTLPSVFWHLQEGQFATTDLSLSSLLRLDALQLHPTSDARMLKHANKREAAPDQELPTELDSHLGSGVDSSVDSNLDLEPEQGSGISWVDHCLALLQAYADSSKATQDQKYYLEQLNALQGDGDSEPLPLIKLLTGWLGWLIKPGLDLRKGSQAQATVLLPLMVTHFMLTETLVDLDRTERNEELDDLEAQVEDPDKNITLLRGAWKSLHQYLIDTKQIESDQYGKGPSLVNADYISEPEFELIRAALYYQGDTTDAVSASLRNVCLVVSTLSYRLGLRRSEVALLATSHIALIHNQPDLLSVQWWCARRLKTDSSTRTLPLKGLLSPQESAWLNLLITARQKGLWVIEEIFDLSTLELERIIGKYRIADGKSAPGAFLFINEDEKAVQTGVDDIVNTIHKAIRAVTDQKKELRFHHLRHSCATNTLMLLLSERLPHSKLFLIDHMYGNRAVKETLAIMKNAQMRISDFSSLSTCIQDFDTRSIKVRDALLNDSRVSISEVYAVSRLLGHSSPITTLKSYIHVMQVLLGAFSHERFIGLPSDLQNAFHPHNQQYLEKSIIQTIALSPNARSDSKPNTDLDLDLKPAPTLTTLLAKKLVGRPVQITSTPFTLVELISQSSGQGLLLCLELRRSYLLDTDSEHLRYFKKAAIAGMDRAMAEQLMTHFDKVFARYSKSKEKRTGDPKILSTLEDEHILLIDPLRRDLTVQYSKVLFDWYAERPLELQSLLSHYVVNSIRSKPNLIRLPLKDQAIRLTARKSRSAKDAPLVGFRELIGGYKKLMDLFECKYIIDGDALRPTNQTGKAPKLVIEKNGTVSAIKKVLYLMAVVTFS